MASKVIASVVALVESDKVAAARSEVCETGRDLGTRHERRQELGRCSQEFSKRRRARAGETLRLDGASAWRKRPRL